jgi:Mg2+ and Co2+ transporter CorA
MKVFTFIAVTTLPQTVIGSLMGMNVPVPFMTSDENTSLMPWFGLIGISVFCSACFYMYFRHKKYI